MPSTGLQQHCNRTCWIWRWSQHNSERSHSFVLLSPLLLVSTALCTCLTHSGAPLTCWIPAMKLSMPKTRGHLTPTNLFAVITRLVVSQVEEEMENNTEIEGGETEGGESRQRSPAPS